MSMTGWNAIFRLTGLATLGAVCGRQISRSIAVVGFTMMVLPMTATAGIEEIRWYHPDPGVVTGFRIVQGSASRVYGTPLDVGLPTPVNDVFSFSITVPDSTDTYVAVVAYNADGDSAPSNETFFGAAPLAPEAAPTPAPEPDLTLDPTLDDSTDLFPPRSDALLFSKFVTALDPEWYDSGANNSLSRDDSLFSVSGIGGTNALTTNNTATNIHSHYVGNDSSSWSNYEYRGRMRITSTASGIGVTAYSDYPNRDAYYRLRRIGGDSSAAFEINAHPSASATLSCSKQSTGVTPNANTWYKFRMQTTNGPRSTIIRAKVWAASGSEPSDWQALCEDFSSGRLNAGAPGVWSMGSGTKAWDDIEIFSVSAGSAPSPAPEPPILIDVVPVEP